MNTTKDALPNAFGGSSTSDNASTEGSVNILIVDDMSIMRIIIKEILINYCGVDNRNIYESSNGKDALMMFKRCKPEIVFLDINMPDLDGVSVTKELILKDPDLHIIMCTSLKHKSDVMECIRAGAKDYITKPPQPERVIKAVEHIIPIPEDSYVVIPAEGQEVVDDKN